MSVPATPAPTAPVRSAGFRASGNVAPFRRGRLRRTEARQPARVAHRILCPAAQVRSTVAEQAARSSVSRFSWRTQARSGQPSSPGRKAPRGRGCSRLVEETCDQRVGMPRTFEINGMCASGYDRKVAAGDRPPWRPDLEPFASAVAVAPKEQRRRGNIDEVMKPRPTAHGFQPRDSRRQPGSLRDGSAGGVFRRGFAFEKPCRGDPARSALRALCSGALHRGLDRLKPPWRCAGRTGSMEHQFANTTRRKTHQLLHDHPAHGVAKQIEFLGRDLRQHPFCTALGRVDGWQMRVLPKPGRSTATSSRPSAKGACMTD